MQEQRQQSLERRIDRTGALDDLLQLELRRILVTHVERETTSLDQRQVGNALAVGLTAPLEELDTAAVQLATKLVQQAAFTCTGFAHDRDELPFACNGGLDCRHQRTQLALTTGELRQGDVGTDQHRRRRIVGSRDELRGDGGAAGSKRHGSQRFAPQGRSRQTAALGGHENLTRFRDLRQTQRDRGRFTDHASGAVGSGGSLHDDGTGVDGRSELDALCDVPAEGLAHRQGGAHRA